MRVRIENRQEVVVTTTVLQEGAMLLNTTICRYSIIDSARNFT
jgi:hypothetical protein